MSGHALTRRSFLVGSAGVAAVAAGAGLVSLSVRGEADADAETDKRTEVVHSLCNSCSSKCGYYAYVVDGELTRPIRTRRASCARAGTAIPRSPIRPIGSPTR